jgi:Fe-S cluster assembly scaffold protein SufB
MSRAELLERYRALPLPDTTEESWRFTDLKGFDPDAFTANGAESLHQAVAKKSMLDIDVAGLATVSVGLEIESAPEGIRFEILDDSHPQLGELVGANEKFAAQNAASWEHGLLVHVPKGVVLEKPLYVRIANPPDGGSFFWRLLVIAEPGSRFSVIEELSSPDPGLA